MSILTGILHHKKVELDTYTSSYDTDLVEEFNRLGYKYMGKGRLFYEDQSLSEVLYHFWKKEQKKEETRENVRKRMKSKQVTLKQMKQHGKT